LEEERDIRQLSPRQGHVPRDDAERLLAVGEAGQVTDLALASPHEGDVLGDERRAELAREVAEPPGARGVDPVRAPERELHSVREDGPDLRDRAGFLSLRGPEAGLGGDLDVVDHTGPREEVRRDLRTPADPGPHPLAPAREDTSSRGLDDLRE